jgi:hypothetical protein
LAGLHESQIELLELETSRSVLVPEAPLRSTFFDLMDVMTKKNLMLQLELDALREPFDVYALHGQLVCMYDQVDQALASLNSALIHKPHAADLIELIARIRLVL